MKRIFIILFFVSLSITAEELHYLTNNVTDIRNKVWYYGTNSFNEIDDFLFQFNNQFVKKTITTKVNSLTGQNLSIYRSLYNRILDMDIMTCMVQIVCNDKYGVLIYLWNDTSSFGSFQNPGLKLMSCYFFEIK